MAQLKLLSGKRRRPSAWWWLVFTLCVLFFVGTLLPGVAVLLSWRVELPDLLANPAVFAWIGMLLMCAMWLLEYTRRGSISAAKRGFEAEIRLLPAVAHLAWFLGLAVLGTVLLVVPWTVDGDLDAFFAWFLWGALITPVHGAVLGSLVKKTAYARRRRRRPGRRRAQRFWRWFSYRWRFDLWLCGFAMLLLVGGALIRWLTHTPDFGDAEDLEEATAVATALLSTGIPAMAVGLWTCTQFWRTGENITTGESAG